MMLFDIVRLIKYSIRDREYRVWLFSLSVVMIFLVLSVLGSIYLSIFRLALEDNIKHGKNYIISQNIKKELLENYSEYSTRVDKIYSGMVGKWSQPELVRNIENLAQRNKIQMKGQTYRQLNDKGWADSYSIDINAAGAYSDIKKFINGLSRLRGKSTVESMKLAHPDSSGDLVLNIKIKVFHIKER